MIGKAGGRACCIVGAPSFTQQHAEQARLRLRKAPGTGSWRTIADEAAGMGPFDPTVGAARVKWLAWLASWLDSISLCGSTAPGVTGIGEEEEDSNDADAGRSIAVPENNRVHRYV